MFTLRVSVLLFLMLAMVSCNVRLLVNGKVEPFPSNVCEINMPLIINQYDKYKIPGSAKYIGCLTVRTGFQSLGFFHVNHYTELRKYAVHQTQKLQGNVMKIIHYHNWYNSKYASSRMTCLIYKLDESQMAEFKKYIDSMERRYSDSTENLCIIHIQNYAGRERKYYLNDSLIGVGKRLGAFHLSDPLDVALKKGGILSSRLLSDALEEETVKVDLGKEYFFETYNYNNYTYYDNRRKKVPNPDKILFFKQMSDRNEYENQVKKIPQGKQPCCRQLMDTTHKSLKRID